MAAGKKDAERRQKEKERERKKRGSRKYGQAKMKHSRMGVGSCIYAGVSLILIILLILYAYLERGNTVSIIGALGLIDMILTILGIRAGAKGLREREKKYTTCRIGIAVNVLVLLFLIVVFLGGI